MKSIIVITIVITIENGPPELLDDLLSFSYLRDSAGKKKKLTKANVEEVSCMSSL